MLAAARAAGVGQHSIHSRHRGSTREAGVCCSMISLTRTPQGVVDGSRHGRSLPFASNHGSSRCTTLVCHVPRHKTGSVRVSAYMHICGRLASFMRMWPGSEVGGLASGWLGFRLSRLLGGLASGWLIGLVPSCVPELPLAWATRERSRQLGGELVGRGVGGLGDGAWQEWSVGPAVTGRGEDSGCCEGKAAPLSERIWCQTPPSFPRRSEVKCLFW